ncbi:hypothetical protein J437_LFUL018154 [Ladona fulva]|uniref:PiggyBac transposable element-derived protein domain-containing protein n=1 Tax=Ladona fulva TaxID=123851 RepID=A0A8K0KRS2_LADFU|nr:hypothetical protein J437_LFUL018154 [Ladona fulva]
MAKENLEAAKSCLQKHSPMQLFEEFFSDDVRSRIFLGILIFSGYHTLPSERDYWSDQEDLGVPLVRDAMSRNTYLEIKSVIHFQNNAKANDNKNDRSFKIRPLIDMVNANFHLAINYGHSLEKMDIVIIFHCTAVLYCTESENINRWEHDFALLDELREKE